MTRRIIAISMLLLAGIILILTPVVAFTPLGVGLSGLLAPTPTPSPTPVPPTPLPSPKPVLTVRGKPSGVKAVVYYLVDMDTGHILVDVRGERPVPMASTTKIMTALIAIQTGNLDRMITVTQNMLNQVPEDASSANLQVGETFSLKELLYGLMLPSGDDAALVIASALGGTTENFVQRMNLFAHRLRLFQTRYTNPHGLNLADDQNHYTTASDLIRLTTYAMNIPLFATIVQQQRYTLPATAQHHAHTWQNTNTLLGSYKGITGVKTGHTNAAGWCLVFAARRNGHYLMGVILDSPNEEQRNTDVRTLLNWGFSLPVLPPKE